MDPFLGQILLVPYNFAPQGWAFCNGQLLNISQNAALYALLGNSFGGDGRSTFGLPDLRSRVPVGVGQGSGLSSYALGQMAGAENVSLTTAQLAAHNHGMTVDASPASTTTPDGGNIAQVNTGTGRTPALVNSYTSGTPAASTQLNGSTIQNAGNGQGHPNIQPVLALNYIIALQGIFPPRS